LTAEGLDTSFLIRARGVVERFIKRGHA